MNTRSHHARDSRQKHVFTVARKILATEGAKAVTMRRIASETGYTAPVIYEHYADKAALLDAILIDAFNHLAAQMQRSRGDDPAQGPREIVHAHLDFAAKNPSVFLFMHGLSGVDIPAVRRFDAARVAVAVTLDALRQQPSTHRDAPSENLRVQAGVLWSLATGLALTASVQPGGFDRVHGLADCALAPLLRAWEGANGWS